MNDSIVKFSKPIIEKIDLEKSISQKIVKYTRSRSGKTILSKKQIGVLVAGISPHKPNTFVIGYSLCHRKDKFDHIKFGEEGTTLLRCPGFGKNLAFKRAINVDGISFVEIPHSIKKQTGQFINRCRRYYKDKELLIKGVNPVFTFLTSKLTSKLKRETND